jgi:hypothetical protein
MKWGFCDLIARGGFVEFVIPKAQETAVSVIH